MEAVRENPPEEQIVEWSRRRLMIESDEPDGVVRVAVREVRVPENSDLPPRAADRGRRNEGIIPDPGRQRRTFPAHDYGSRSTRSL